MAEIKKPNYIDQPEQGGTKKSMKAKLRSIQAEYERKRTLYKGLTV